MHRIGGVLGLTLISVVVGLALALAHHVLATRVQRFAVQHDGALSLALILGGRTGLLAVVIIIFFVLAIWSPLNIIAMLAAFLVVFSALLVWNVYRLMSKQRSAPPSAGAHGL